ncbi:MAG: UDP-N-acetylglucosamine 2-epimerase, partial [Myxococcales bacterium]|nr:UDP-N-acetylglucosamine 2-epimerase [Myxococcales bacterium]
MKMVTVVGARPQFVKIAAICRAVERHNAGRPDYPINHVIVHTGQHYDYELSQIFFDQLKLKPPEYHLEVGSGSHAIQTAEMLRCLEPVLSSESPDLVLVVGDTNSTLAAALVAAKLHFPIAHVEAGQRRFDRNMPEEINRVIADHLSTLLFCASKVSVANLSSEGLTNSVENGALILEDI